MVCKECSLHWKPEENNGDKKDSAQFVYIYFIDEDKDEEEVYKL